MDKRIIKLSREPFRVGLEDRSCSIFIDPKVGTILIDEGEGEDRLNGAVMYPDKAPLFSVATEDGKGNVLLLNYSGFRLVVGTVKDAKETQEWASSANRFLATKAAQTPEPSTTILKSPPPDQTSPGVVLTSFPVANGAVRKETTNGISKADLPSSTDRPIHLPGISTWDPSHSESDDAVSVEDDLIPKPSQHTIDLFSTMFKWAHRQDENFLTEAFAYIINQLLNREHELGRDFLNWLCFGSGEPCEFEGPLEVTTQIRVNQGQPDIWIQGQEFLCLIEIKKESELGEDQLQRYRSILRESKKTHQRLVLLTRHFVEFEEGDEKPDIHIRWSEIADQLKKLTTGSPVTGYLIDQFLEFLRYQVMTIEPVRGELIAGIQAQRNLMVMLEKALELAKIDVHQASAGWNFVGYYLDKKQFWVGIEYQWPHLISFGFCDSVPDLNRFRSWGFGGIDQKGIPYFGFDMRGENTGFLTLSADEQLSKLKKFLESAYKAAKETISSPTPANPDAPPTSS